MIKKRSLFILVLLLLGIVCLINPACAELYTWTDTATEPYIGQDHTANHFDAWVTANTSWAWGNYYWSTVDWGGYTGGGFIDTIQPDSATVTVTCGSNPLITGDYNFECRGGNCFDFSTGAFSLGIDFGNQTPAFNYTGVCQVTGFPGNVVTFYGGNFNPTVIPATDVVMPFIGINTAIGNLPFSGNNYFLGDNEPGGAPTTPRTITVNVKNLAGQNLETPIDISLNDMSQSSVGYTDTNGNYTDTLNVGTNTSTHIQLLSHGIYEQLDWDFNFDSTPWYAQLIMFQASPSGTYRNITYHLQDNTGSPLNHVWVTHIVSPSSQSSEYTDANGNTTFNNVPVVSNSANYNAYLAGYLQSYGAFSFVSDLYKVVVLSVDTGVTPTFTPSPTITPIGTDAWTLTPMYNSIALGDAVGLITSCVNNTKEQFEGGASTVLYYEQAPSENMMLIGTYHYNTSSSNWDFRTGNTAPWQLNPSFDQMQITAHPTKSGLNRYEVRVYDANSVSMGVASTNVLVGGSGALGALTMVLQAQDQLIGAHLTNYQMNITDDITGELTEFGTVAYSHSMSLSRGSTFTLRASKLGYDDGSYTFAVPTNMAIIEGSMGAIATVNMFPIGSIVNGNTSISVHVYDAETYYPLGAVQISISGIGINLPASYTGQSGESAYFSIPQNTLYTVTAVKEGYCTILETGNSGTETNQYVPLFMHLGACVAPTPIPTPDGGGGGGNVTPIPTATPIGGYGQLTGNATTCRSLDSLPNATYMDVIKNALACNGITDELGQNLALAMLIMIIGGLLLGKVGKGIGVIAGVMVGAVVSLAMGFLPIWIIIVLMVIAGLIFSVKLFGASP